jgi:heat shock protein HslJ
MTAHHERATELARLRPRAAISVLAASILSLALVACGDDEPSSDTGAPRAASTQPGTTMSSTTPAPAAGALSGTTWTLSSAVVEGEAAPAVGTAALTFAPDGSSLSGSTGCNQFSGTYVESGGDLTITLGPVTRAACVDPAATAQETAILAQLPKVAQFTADDELILKDSAATTLLTYAAASTELAGSNWAATGVNSGEGGVTSTTLTNTVTAAFGADGTVSGFAGCNTYNGTYEQSGNDALTLLNIATTKKACGGRDDAGEPVPRRARQRGHVLDSGRHADVARRGWQHPGDVHPIGVARCRNSGESG